MIMSRMAMMALLLTSSAAWAQAQVPDRQIPPSVLVELRVLENRFDIALAADCDANRCFSKGCSYVDHAVSDRPKKTSLPGLAQEPGPSASAAQEYLTQAHCSFAYEPSVEAGDVQALSRRLQSKLTKGWTVVSVQPERLQPLPQYLQEPHVPEDEPGLEPEEEALVAQPEPWSVSTAAQELWTQLLPDFYWMIGLFMLTFAGTVLIWAWRRVGRASIEEQMLLAEINGGGPLSDDDDEEGESEAPAVDETDFVSAQHIAWTERLAATVETPDPQLGALVRELLRAGDLPLLAKAVLRFPERFPAIFPEGGEVASAKLQLVEYLTTVDAEALPADADFFRALNRHALSAALSSQSDAQIVRSIRQDFGAFGLASLIGKLSGRAGALLFALAPTDEQYEMVRLIEPQKTAEMAQMLLRSNRMDPAEMAYLFEVVSAVRDDLPLPPAPTAEISDRGSEFDAVGALSVLLESVNPGRRSALFGAALERFQGSLPAWYRGILVADMLFALSNEARADLLLEVDVQTLAAWLSLLDSESQDRILAGLPGALQASVDASSSFPSRAEQLALAARGRRDLARGFQLQLARSNVSFEHVVRPPAKADS